MYARINTSLRHLLLIVIQIILFYAKGFCFRETKISFTIFIYSYSLLEVHFSVSLTLLLLSVCRPRTKSSVNQSTYLRLFPFLQLETPISLHYLYLTLIKVRYWIPLMSMFSTYILACMGFKEGICFQSNQCTSRLSCAIVNNRNVGRWYLFVTENKAKLRRFRPPERARRASGAQVMQSTHSTKRLNFVTTRLENVIPRK